MLLAQADPDLVTVLERLDSGQVFALSMTFVVVVAAATVALAYIFFTSIQRTKETQVRTTFVRKLVDQGMDADGVARLAEITFSTDAKAKSREALEQAALHASVPKAKPVPERRPVSAVPSQP